MSTRELPPQEKELLAGKINELLQRIQYQEDPAEMDMLRSLYKKHVPIFRRSYFSAMLLRELAHSQGIRLDIPAGKKKEPRSSRFERSARPERPEKKKRPEKTPRSKQNDTAARGSEAVTIPAADEDSGTIFISIGKNRRVFPRDLIGLFSSVDGVTPEKIGDIRILDNYSFVSVDPDIAAEIITALHNSDYRGRNLTVNFARKKT